MFVKDRLGRCTKEGDLVVCSDGRRDVMVRTAIKITPKGIKVIESNSPNSKHEVFRPSSGFVNIQYLKELEPELFI